MNPRMLRAIGLLPCLGLLGCQTPDLSADINEYGNLIDDAIQQLCECHQDAGYGSRSECSDSLGFVSLDDRECIEDALDGYESEGRDYLACANAAHRDYLSCLTNNALTCPDGGVAACRDANTVALGQCDQLPPAVETVVMTCTSP